MKSCNDVMTKDPTCCLVSDGIARAAEIMKNEDVGSVPVVEDDVTRRLVGIVTDRDIVLKIIAENRDRDAATVGEIMSTSLVTCRPDDHYQTAMDRMSQHQVRRIPVVDGKGRIVGIISQADIATRVDAPRRMAEVVENISQPVQGARI